MLKVILLLYVYCFGSLEQRIGILKILKKFKIKNVIEIFLYLSVDNAYRKNDI